MNRRLALLLLLVLGSLSLSANVQYEPNARYRVVFILDKPQAMPDEHWQFFASPLLGLRDPAIQYKLAGHTLYLTDNDMRGRSIEPTMQRKVFEHFDSRWRVIQVIKHPLTPEEQALENIKKQQAEEDKARALKKLADENDPRRTVDAKGKPIYNAGSPEAEAQLRESAAEQDKSAAKFKQYNQGGTNGPVTGEGLRGKPVYNAGSPEADAQLQESAREQDKAAQKHRESGAWGNGPVTGEGLLGQPVKNAGADDEAFAGGGAQKPKAKSAGSDFPDEPEDKRPLSQRIMNRPASPAPATAPRAAEDEPAARLVPTSGNKYSKPVPPQKGTKKEDTLFKNQKQPPPAPPKSE